MKEGRAKKGALPLRAIFALPLIIAVLGVIGLVSALTGDGWRDWISWAGLAVPIAVTIWATKTRRT